MTPAEVIAAATCSGPRFGGGPGPCEVCRGRAERDVAALAEGGYAIVPVAPAQPPGTIQSASEDGPGISGRSDLSEASTGLSVPRGWNRTVNAHGIPIVWKILDEGDLIVGSPLVADPDTAVEQVTDLPPESAITRYLRTSREATDRG